MLPVPVPPWPVLGALAGGIGAVWLAWTIRQYRGKPGVDWFLFVFAAQALWCVAYGIGLLVTDPLLRKVLEGVAWLGIIWTGIAFLGFALEYTGRAEVIRSRLFVGSVGFGLLSTALLVTNPLHGLFWTGFRIDPVFEVATVSYAFGPWAYLVVAVGSVLVASAVFLLVDTLLRYGPLYRAESAAVALSSLPPGLALVAWTLELGPVPQLQLAPLMFVPHVLLDAYAFNRAEMFERHPTTSRAVERTAINDLADPVIALAPDRRIVSLNPAAETVLGAKAEEARDRSIEQFLPIDLPDGRSEDGAERTADDGSVTLTVDRERRNYAVSMSSLADPRGIDVGHMIILSDVTERERRRQQLEVLNRILRHNLRNDAGVVHGYGELLAERLEDPELRGMADAIERRAGALARLGDKTNTVETLLSDGDPTPVDVDALVGGVVAELRQQYPDAVIEYETDIDDPTLDIREDAFRAALTNTIGNALDHHDGDGKVEEDGRPWTRVILRKERSAGTASQSSPATVVCTVEDDGPGIPAHELQAIEAGQETALEHGSGLGLWIVEWAAAALGATVEYEKRKPRGTRVTMYIPLATRESDESADQTSDA